MPSYFDEGADDSDPYEDRKEPSPKEPAPYEATTSQEFSGRAPAVADERQSGQTATVEPPGPPSSGGPVIQQGGFAYSGDRFKQDLLTAQARQVYDALPQQAKVHYALSQLELSRSEAMQAQRLQNTIGAIEAHPGLTRGQKDDLIFQARTKLNPMLIRQARANEIKTQQQTEQLMHANAQAESMRAQDEAFALGNLEKLPLVTVPDTGEKKRMLRDKSGKWYDPFESGRKAAATAEAAKEAKETAAKAAEQKQKLDIAKFEHEKETIHTEKDRAFHAGLLGKAIDSADAEIEEARKAGGKKGTLDIRPWQGNEDDLHRILVEQKMAKHKLPADTEEYVKQQSAARTGKPITPPANAPAKNPPPDNEKAVASSRPFTLDMTNRGSGGAKNEDPLHTINTKDLSDEQKQYVDALKAIRLKIHGKSWTERSRWGGQVGDTTAGDELKARHLQDVDDMAEVLAKYGSPANMEKQDPAQYARWNAQLLYWRKLFPK